jgi:hypothetical protein
MSPYYWWWQYLRRNADYIACCEKGGKGKLAKLYADFGDVRDDNFHKWWTTDERGAVLFGEQPLTAKFAELNSASDWQPNWDKDAVMVISIPLAMSKRRLKSEFSKLLDMRHSGHKPGRPSLTNMKAVSTAKYKIERNYTINNLMTALEVYDLWNANQSKPKNERLTLWEIGKSLNLNKNYNADAISANSADRLIGRNILGATTGRYIRQAKSIISNTSLGKFPMQ